MSLKTVYLKITCDISPIEEHEAETLPVMAVPPINFDQFLYLQLQNSCFFFLFITLLNPQSFHSSLVDESLVTGADYAEIFNMTTKRKEKKSGIESISRVGRSKFSIVQCGTRVS